MLGLPPVVDVESRQGKGQHRGNDKPDHETTSPGTRGRLERRSPPSFVSTEYADVKKIIR